jgi:hydrogenase expression/formation protein HypC
MCLAIPGKILETYDDNGMKMGRVDTSGAVTTVCLEYVDEAEAGKYVLVHAGFAISVLDEEEASCSLSTWGDLIEKAESNEEYRIEWTNPRGKEVT